VDVGEAGERILEFREVLRFSRAMDAPIILVDAAEAEVGKLSKAYQSQQVGQFPLWNTAQPNRPRPFFYARWQLQLGGVQPGNGSTTTPSGNSTFCDA
jgi:hypothetical protein